ncbi:hypothetical protein DPMN_064673 [Dreissena polymorpha]|uniref:Uncharacterized protein n=1 Tax=Dreissena polymorpha TaxID=45954 RepID=A0A9D4CDV4_DREPO|nr:hypothetical protein DPMN_064673 [Dreissena polymorpha]
MYLNIIRTRKVLRLIYTQYSGSNLHDNREVVGSDLHAYINSVECDLHTNREDVGFNLHDNTEDLGPDMYEDREILGSDLHEKREGIGSDLQIGGNDSLSKAGNELDDEDISFIHLLKCHKNPVENTTQQSDTQHSRTSTNLNYTIGKKCRRMEKKSDEKTS